ncbi:Bacterioferritin (cytochrome b1) [Quadrisphaera granulorum]|uniref:Bacterioferritin (Cytochrome b1) n=1 Tax=Quadrisphaera granulorum TaxID=317664 RepID=A0A316AEJ9_9ACTN|nr:ferritin-like fold-containing protein [Quadrisphaera granulorum]PWJ56205.1 bacterioferritin (cytochrome b1) [Quadrisphaera granulorum]SZE94839.1 Bacterioferritin (cytochrome b1) [Quadrisphaera granulorum]
MTPPRLSRSSDGADRGGARGETLQAEIDLLGALAYGELTGFLRLSAHADKAPTLEQTAEVGALAVEEFHHYQLLVERLRELGADPQGAMRPFVAAVDAYHERTTPNDWLEGLLKAYVGEGIATDFYREVAAFAPEPTRDLVVRLLDETSGAEFVVGAVLEATERDPRVAGRLALWGRRLVGEALSQAQRVAADRSSLTTLLVEGGGAGTDLVAIGKMFNRLTENHVRRMLRLGLTA